MIVSQVYPLAKHHVQKRATEFLLLGRRILIGYLPLLAARFCLKREPAQS